MIVRIDADLEHRSGMGEGPRIRPRRSRWRVARHDVWLARSRREVPVAVVGERGPRVLVSMDQDSDGPFVHVQDVDAVVGSGGTAVLVPPGETDVDTLLALADGVVLTGGAFDIHPAHYGQQRQGRLDAIDEARTSTELALAAGALGQGIPLLGICGGMQAMAVAAGGTLVQDLPADPTHEQPTDPAVPWHSVHCAAPLSDLLGRGLSVNSTHHQAVRDPGEGLSAVAWSPDGVIEALVAAEHPFAMGVQWHPERLGDRRLQDALVKAASSVRAHTTMWARGRS